MSSVDDFIYAFDSAGNYKYPGPSDYYFSSVKVTQKDTGYDPWEDRTDTPEAAGGTDIYAMYKGQNTWEKVGTVSGIPVDLWNMSLRRNSWRVSHGRSEGRAQYDKLENKSVI